MRETNSTFIFPTVILLTFVIADLLFSIIPLISCLPSKVKLSPPKLDGAVSLTLSGKSNCVFHIYKT